MEWAKDVPILFVIVILRISRRPPHLDGRGRIQCAPATIFLSWHLPPLLPFVARSFLQGYFLPAIPVLGPIEARMSKKDNLAAAASSGPDYVNQLPENKLHKIDPMSFKQLGTGCSGRCAPESRRARCTGREGERLPGKDSMAFSSLIGARVIVAILAVPGCLILELRIFPADEPSLT